MTHEHEWWETETLEVTLESFYRRRYSKVSVSPILLKTVTIPCTHTVFPRWYNSSISNVTTELHSNNSSCFTEAASLREGYILRIFTFSALICKVGITIASSQGSNDERGKLYITWEIVIRCKGAGWGGKECLWISMLISRFSDISSSA